MPRHNCISNDASNAKHHSVRMQFLMIFLSLATVCLTSTRYARRQIFSQIRWIMSRSTMIRRIIFTIQSPAWYSKRTKLVYNCMRRTNSKISLQEILIRSHCVFVWSPGKGKSLRSCSWMTPKRVWNFSQKQHEFLDRFVLSLVKAGMAYFSPSTA